MAEDEKIRRISISEICRIEGHASVHVELEGDRVSNVKMDVFEGMRFFEKIVIGHKADQMPHITSRVCAICSTGHVLASIRAIEHILGYVEEPVIRLLRELMQLGMIIESHATHIYALALPDFLGVEDIHDLAGLHPIAFEKWTRLRKLGALIQTSIGGRPFHPVNLQVGGFSSFPPAKSLHAIADALRDSIATAIDTCETLMGFNPPVARTSTPVFLALIPDSSEYGYFGNRIRFSSGEEYSIQEYREYLCEEPVAYSHAKRSSVKGEPIMVGSMARLNLFGERLGGDALALYRQSPLSRGDTNSIWNNLAQAIEIVEAIQRALEIIDLLQSTHGQWSRPAYQSRQELSPAKGASAGAVECPRGTLYHYYEIDEEGFVREADMITPSAQNTYRIERDIHEVVSQALQEFQELQALEESEDSSKESILAGHLETLVRAYDPCNTCAAHMVSLKFSSIENQDRIEK